MIILAATTSTTLVTSGTLTSNMIITTTWNIPGKETRETIGLVQGSVVKSRHVGHDILSALKTLVGGELRSYTELLEQAREEAMRRMIKEAEAQGADAVIGVSFTTSSIAAGASEILVYGTAVKC